MNALWSHCFWYVWSPFVPFLFEFFSFLGRKLWLIFVVLWKRFYLWSLKFETWNLEFKTLKFGIENLEFGIENLKFGIENLRFGIKDLKLEIENLTFGIESLMLRHCHCVVVCSCWNLGHCRVGHVVILALGHFLFL